MNRNTVGLAFSIGMLFCGSTFAQEQFVVSADVGSTGVGLRLAAPIDGRFQARVGLNYLRYAQTGTTSSIEYAYKLRFQALEGLVDWYPTQNQFRISGGIAFSTNQIAVRAKPNSDAMYTFNGRRYNVADAGIIDGSVDFRKSQPYLGIGWGKASARQGGWGLTADLGLFYQGAVATSLNNSGCTLPELTCAALVQDVAQENTKLTDKLSGYTVYPVLRIGGSYQF